MCDVVADSDDIVRRNMQNDLTVTAARLAVFAGSHIHAERVAAGEFHIEEPP
jgi:hypothetical protein